MPRHWNPTSFQIFVEWFIGARCFSLMMIIWYCKMAKCGQKCILPLRPALRSVHRRPRWRFLFRNLKNYIFLLMNYCLFVWSWPRVLREMIIKNMWYCKMAKCGQKCIPCCAPLFALCTEGQDEDFCSETKKNIFSYLWTIVCLFDLGLGYLERCFSLKMIIWYCKMVKCGQKCILLLCPSLHSKQSMLHFEKILSDRKFNELNKICGRLPILRPDIDYRDKHL